MTPEYPKFYLDGNIALQEVVDNYRDWARRTLWKWLALTCACFSFLLLGVVFEQPVLSFLAAIDLLICARAIHMLLTPREGSSL